MDTVTQEWFVVTRIHRNDLSVLVKDKWEQIPDELMAQIAEEMGDAYVENGFWTDLGIIAPEVLEKWLAGAKE